MIAICVSMAGLIVLFQNCEQKKFQVTNFVNKELNGFAPVVDLPSVESELQLDLPADPDTFQNDPILSNENPSLSTTALIVGKTYYVAKTGSDISGTGTMEKPFKTIPHGYSKINPGDTLIVRAGVYNEYRPNYGLHFNKKTTSASKPIIIKSEVKGAAIIDLLNKPDAQSGIWLSGHYHTIDGFKIRNAVNGVIVYGNYNKIVRNEIYNNGNGGDPKSIYGQSGVFSGDYSYNNIYDRNYVHHNGRIKYNSGLDHGFYLVGANEIVMNNIVTYNSAMGIKVAGYETSASNTHVYNNISAFNGHSGLFVYKKISNISFRNNIIYKNKRYAVTIHSIIGSGIVFSNNSYYGHLSTSPRINVIPTGSFKISETSIFTANPLFLNELSDYRLQSSSPLINKGWNTSATVKVDYLGVTRPKGGVVDIGAHER